MFGTTQRVSKNDLQKILPFLVNLAISPLITVLRKMVCISLWLLSKVKPTIIFVRTIPTVLITCETWSINVFSNFKD